MRTNDRGGITAQEDDEENYSNEEHNTRGLTDCVEPSSDEHAHSNDEAENSTPPGISHRIS